MEKKKIGGCVERRVRILKIGICVIGAGRVGVFHCKNILTRIPKAELMGIYDINEEIAQKASQELGIKYFKSLEEIAQDENIQGIVITTPTFTHFDLALYFMKAKKHIFCEKPISITLEEAKEMKKVKEENNVKFQLGFMRRFDPAFIEAKEMINSGVLGDIMSIRSITRGPGLPPEWAWDVKKSNGFLAEVNSHDFDSVRWLCGSNFKEVFAYGVVKKAKEILQKYPDFYDTAIVNFILENNTVGVIEGSCPVEYGYDARVEILGTKGLLVIGEVKDDKAVSFYNTEKKLFTRSYKSWTERFKEAYVSELEHFVESIIQDSEPKVSIDDGIEALKAVLAANKSIREGKPIRVNFIGGN